MIAKNSKILITGGHLTPALAIIDELIKRDYNNFVWVGHKYSQYGNTAESAEYQIITSLDIKFIELKTGKLTRKWTLETVKSGIENFFLFFSGFFEAFKIIAKVRPKLIISFGGFLAVPIVIWGRILGTRVVTHEQTIITGLANKIIGFFANRIFISWRESAKYFPKRKTILVGNPVRKEILAEQPRNITNGLNPDLPTLLITGGNQGAHEINLRIFACLERLLVNFNVIHQTGNSTVTKDYEMAVKIKNELYGEVRKRYIFSDYFNSTEMAEVMQYADISISRAGANTISELMLLGKRSILIPIPWTSHDEQTKNALLIASTGLGIILKQDSSLTPESLYDVCLLALLKIQKNEGFDDRRFELCRYDARNLVLQHIDAAERFVDEIELLR